jgi:eukaryotic-like serine/threonine-protein kinase
MADSVRDRTGQQLGNYRLLRLLRQDSTADVYLGEHIFLKTQAAIRMLSESLSQEVLEAFLAETRRIALLKHPNILRVLEFGVESRTPFLVTDYTSFGSLGQRHPEGTSISRESISTYIKQIAAALTYIHDHGLVHGGVRPENMLLGPQNRILLTNPIPIIDALDVISTRNNPTSKEARGDTLKYMAPEQLAGSAEPASDQYALAVVVYEWLSGDTPFHISSNEIAAQSQSLTPIPLHMKMLEVPAQIEQVVMMALAKDPRQRFASVGAFVQALEYVLQPTQPPDATLPGGNENTRTDVRTVIASLPKTRKKSNIARVLTIGLVLTILLIISSGLIYYARLFPSPVPPVVSSITTAQETQTVVARGTQQAVATFASQPTQEIYTLATRGSPFINDPLNNKGKSTWESVKASTRSCTFSSGAYHVQVSGKSVYTSCLARNNTFHNFAYEVEMSIVKGDDAGIVFRSDANWSNFYAFETSSSGSNAVGTLIRYRKDRAKDLQGTVFPVNLQASNLFTVVAYEHIFYFYLNKKILMRFQDNDGALEMGTVGMYVLTAKSTVTEAAFRNAKIWKL